MGYYPIKCIHCMRPLRMEERCMKLDPEEIKSFESGFSKAAEVNLNEEVEIIEETSRSRRADKKIIYKSLAQLKKM